MKIVKKIFYIIPLIITIIFVYGTVTGKFRQKAEELKVSMDEKKEEAIKESEATEDGSSENETVEIPEGKIVLKDYFKEWEREPLTDVYDPDNKIAKNDVYGMTKDEKEYKEALQDEQEKLREESDIPVEYRGFEVFNKEKIVEWDNEFEIEYAKATCKCKNPVIRDGLNGLDESYYLDEKSVILNELDENGCIKESVIQKNDEEIGSTKYKLVMFDIEIVPHSDWVTEWEVLPYLYFLNDRGDALISSWIENEAYYFGRLDTLINSARPVYSDLGLYDVDKAGDNENIAVCPMRKGEVISFTVGYIIPEVLFDKAYFVLNPDNYTATDYSYLAKDVAIFKLGK